MNAYLLCAVLATTPQASDYYSGAVPVAPSASDYYSGPKEPLPTVPQKEIEEDEPEPEPPATPVVRDRNRVIVYLDFSDSDGLRRIVRDTDSLDYIKWAFRNKDQVPPEGRKFKLPLLHFSIGTDKWGFRSGWPGATEFAAEWGRYNQREVASASVGANTTRSTNPAYSTSSSVYHARSYEWTLVGNNNAAALRNHLASPQPEHHGAYFDRAWLNGLSFHELVGLHSDAHNNRVQWQYVGKRVVSSPEPAADMTPKERKKAEKKIGQIVYGTADGKHPGRVGGYVRGLFGDPRYYGGCPNGNCPR